MQRSFHVHKPLVFSVFNPSPNVFRDVRILDAPHDALDHLAVRAEAFQCPLGDVRPFGPGQGF